MVSYPFSLFASALLLVKNSSPNCCHLSNPSRDPKPSAEPKMYGFCIVLETGLLKKKTV
jgi:hypothetical protein